MPDPWTIEADGLTLELRLAPSGHVGFFPEQLQSWHWLRDRLRTAAGGASVLNLFAHTGGGTLVAAAEGGSVAHVDASRPAVAWARRNAELSGLDDRPIRWLVDDALAFARREVRRDRAYQGIVLDPPSYGHAPNRTRWHLGEHLPLLLDACVRLLADADAFVLLTAHTPDFGAARLQWQLADSLGRPAAEVEAGRLEIPARHGPALPAGAFARVPARAGPA